MLTGMVIGCAVALFSLLVGYWLRKTEERKLERQRLQNMQYLIGEELISNYRQLSSFSVERGRPCYASPAEFCSTPVVEAYLNELSKLPRDQLSQVYGAYKACKNLLSALPELYRQLSENPLVAFRKEEQAELDKSNEPLQRMLEHVTHALTNLEKALRALPEGQERIDKYWQDPGRKFPERIADNPIADDEVR